MKFIKKFINNKIDHEYLDPHLIIDPHNVVDVNDFITNINFYLLFLVKFINTNFFYLFILSFYLILTENKNKKEEKRSTILHEFVGTSEEIQNWDFEISKNI